MDLDLRSYQEAAWQQESTILPVHMFSCMFVWGWRVKTQILIKKHVLLFQSLGLPLVNSHYVWLPARFSLAFKKLVLIAFYF